MNGIFSKQVFPLNSTLSRFDIIKDIVTGFEFLIS